MLEVQDDEDKAINNNSANTQTTTPPSSLKDLFEGIDFKTTNLAQLEKSWKEELGEIEKNNIAALIASSAAVSADDQALKVIAQIGSSLAEKATLLSTHVLHLQSMEAEIEQIQQINHGLSVQSENQVKLLALLENVFSHLNFISDDQLWTLEQTNFSSLLLDQQSLKEVSSTAITLFEGIRKIQHFLGEEGLLGLNAAEERLLYLSDYLETFTERLYSFLQSFFKMQSMSPAGTTSSSLMECDNSILTSMVGNAELLTLLSSLSPQRSLDLLSDIQGVLSTMVLGELELFLKCLKRQHLFYAQEDPFKSVFQTQQQQQQQQQQQHKPSKGTPFTKQDYSLMALDSFVDPSCIAMPPPSSLFVASQLINYVLISLTSLRKKEEIVFGKYFFGFPLDASRNKDPQETTDAKLTQTIWAKAPSMILDWIKDLSLQDPLVVLESTFVVAGRIGGAATCCKDPLLIELSEALLALLNSFFKTQLAFLKGNRSGSGGSKRIGVFDCFKRFTRLISSITARIVRAGFVSGGSSGGNQNDQNNNNNNSNQNDNSNQNNNHSPIDIVNGKLIEIHQSLFLVLDLMISDALKSGDEKFIQNAGVMAIQNTNYLVSSSALLENVTLKSVKQITKASASRLGDDLESYCVYSMTRVAPKLIDFFNSFEREIEKKKGPSGDLKDISFMPLFTEPTVRAFLGLYSVKEMKKRLLLVYQRIDKHFTGDQFLMQQVWKCLLEYLVKKTTDWNAMLRKVFLGGEVVQLSWDEDGIRKVFDSIHR